MTTIPIYDSSSGIRFGGKKSFGFELCEAFRRTTVTSNDIDADDHLAEVTLRVEKCLQIDSKRGNYDKDAS